MVMGGTQYKVATDDLITVERVAEVQVGEYVRNESVLLVGSRAATVIGTPFLEGVSVQLVVEEQALADKVIIFKKRRRKGYRRWKGHRAPLTVMRVDDICLPPQLATRLAQAEEARCEHVRQSTLSR